MLGRMVLICAAASLPATAIAAPVKAGHEAPPQAERPAQVLMASAEQPQPELQQPVEEAAVTPVKKPRAARVTTCRCANQTPDSQH